MTREDIIDLLAFARVYDGRVTVGKAEAAAWFLAVGRLPLDVAQAAVAAHYTAPVELGGEVPRIAPGHVMAYYQAHNRPYDKPIPELAAAPKASPGHVARVREQMATVIAKAADRWALDDDASEDEHGPKWRPGADKRELARKQAEAARRLRTGGTA
jgi:hypothetical protein